MNKYSIYSGFMMKLAFLFLSIVVILTGCNLSLLQRDNQNFGSLTLHISEPRFDASTILPETFDVDHYGVLLQTPANDDITAGNITESSYTITDIPVRTWTITGYAYNAAGVEVGRTAQPVEITIDSGTNTATVPIDILVEGTGIVDVSYSWTAALVDEATLTMTNYPGGGVVDISGISSIDLADGTASVNGEIGSGTYLLTWSSSINDVSHPAVREILQVYDNHTSSEVIVLDDLRFNTSPSAPTSLAAFMPDLDTINLSWTDNSDGESAYRVYRDGTLLADLTSNVTSYSDSISGLITMPTSYMVEVENLVGSTSTDYSVPVASGITFGQTAYPISSVGSTAELSIEFLPSDTLNQFVTFDSSDSAQVSVTAEGVATLETGFGEATITATSDDGGYTASALVGYVPVMEVTAHEAVGYGIQNGYSSIDTGYYHTVITRTDDSIVSSGQGDYGQLGSGGTADRYIPGVVSGISALASVSAGGYHTLAVGDDGKLYAWGYNYYYQIGDATSTNRYSPVLVGSGYATVSAGKYHSLAVKTDGTLWAWGENASGRLGTGDTVDKSTPTQVGSVTNWSSVAAGEDHSLAVTTDGKLYAWGDNGSYEIGDGTYTDRNAPVQIGSDTDWVDVSAGSNFSIAIKSDGSLYAWGYNGSGRLGVGDSTSRTAPTRVGTASNWDAVSAGYDHALAVTTDGKLYAWGDNGSYEIGDGTYTDRNAPVQIGSDTDWVDVSAGYNFSIAIKSDGTVYGWGNNTNGQLGTGTTYTYTGPTPIRNRTVEPGNEITVDVRVHNSGVLSGIDLTGVMSSSSDYVTGFARSSYSFGTLAADYYRTITDSVPTTSATSANLEALRLGNYVFTLSPDTPVGTLIPMTLTFTDESSRSWTDSFSIEVPE